MKLVFAMIVAMLIGAACRWFDLPVPAPPVLSGALLVVAMTLGYSVTDKLVANQRPLPAQTTPAAIMPTGATRLIEPPVATEPRK